MTQTLLQLAPDLLSAISGVRKLDRLLHAAAFVARCSGAATCAYAAAAFIALPNPVWAVMSALVVSQEKLADTNTSFTGRICGTLIGIAAGVTTDAVASRLAIG